MGPVIDNKADLADETTPSSPDLIPITRKVNAKANKSASAVRTRPESRI
jgi:hypothetical protein